MLAFECEDNLHSTSYEDIVLGNTQKLAVDDKSTRFKAHKERPNNNLR